nr:hypothetical protein [Bradyrhizobium erythrophlei]
MLAQAKIRAIAERKLLVRLAVRAEAERFDDFAIWELMYFGKVRDLSVPNELDKGL